MIAIATHFILFVFRIRAFEIHNLRVALESKDVRTYTVEKPTVVRDDDGTTGEVGKPIFEGA